MEFNAIPYQHNQVYKKAVTFELESAPVFPCTFFIGDNGIITGIRNTPNKMGYHMTDYILEYKG